MQVQQVLKLLGPIAGALVLLVPAGTPAAKLAVLANQILQTYLANESGKQAAAFGLMSPPPSLALHDLPSEPWTPEVFANWAETHAHRSIPRDGQ